MCKNMSFAGIILFERTFLENYDFSGREQTVRIFVIHVILGVLQGYTL